MKLSEAKILIFLSQVQNTDKYLGNISTKLKMDYAYCIRILKQMQANGWIKPAVRVSGKSYYSLYSTAPIEQAKKVLLERK